MKQQFHPLQGKAGESRVAVNLSELGDRAWQILAPSQDLGFDTPRFVTHTRTSGFSEVWAILLQQVHRYDANTRIVVDSWDSQIDTLRQAIGTDNEFSLIMLCNFQDYLEPAV